MASELFKRDHKDKADIKVLTSSRGYERGRKIVTRQSTYGTVQLLMTHLNLNMLTEQRSLHI